MQKRCREVVYDYCCLLLPVVVVVAADGSNQMDLLEINPPYLPRMDHHHHLHHHPCLDPMEITVFVVAATTMMVDLTISMVVADFHLVPSRNQN